jgi:MFS superfamily sulfate permease-like transporter
VICSAVITLIEWPEFIKAFWIAPIYCVIMTATFLITAVVDVAMGLEFGLILSVLVVSVCVCLFVPVCF